MAVSLVRHGVPGVTVLMKPRGSLTADWRAVTTGAGGSAITACRPAGWNRVGFIWLNTLANVTKLPRQAHIRKIREKVSSDRQAAIPVPAAKTRKMNTTYRAVERAEGAAP